MIVSNQEIAIHLKIIRNLSAYNSLNCNLRVNIFQIAQNVRYDATPVNVIEKNTNNTSNRSECLQNHYVSRSFCLKYSSNIQLNEICIFKLDSPLSKAIQSELPKLVINCELVQIGNDTNKVVGVYNGNLLDFTQQEYFEMDFYSTVPCQVVGSLHRCNYKYQFRGDQGELVDLKTYCEKIHKVAIDPFLLFMQQQALTNYQDTIKNYRVITQQQPIDTKDNQSHNCKQTSLKPEPDTTIGQTFITEEDQELPSVEQPRQRKRIFSRTREGRAKKYQTSQKNMHQIALKIYAVWQQLLASLFSKEAGHFIIQAQQSYRRRLIEKVGQSVTRFKGNWDVDSYGDESNLRDKLANQLRSQSLQIFQSVNPSQRNLIGMINDDFFTKQRPIFFEQKALKSQIQNEKPPNQIFVVLVHGLGACRPDMQKIKSQLKRYYNTKVRVFTSAANQGRTEGDIDAMGMRLAIQIQSELSQSANIPKICMVGHSMGGLIIRSALPRLQKYKKYFHSLITLSTPHLGYSYSDSRIVDAGLWLLSTVKKCTSIQQMTMEDSLKPEETFLYKLSMKPGLDWFSKVVLVSSRQDLYVPYYSARIQKHSQSMLDNRKKLNKGILHCSMVDNILQNVKGSLTRLDINFTIQQNIDNLIGRAAHISLINNVEMVRTLVLAGSHFFF